MQDGRPMRLYCFPHAGAGIAAFGRWPHGTGPGIRTEPVLLPGREARRREPRITAVRPLLVDLLRHHGRPPDGRYVLYGHSLGALVAYTVARAVHRAGLPEPALVAVGACPPPDRDPFPDGLADDRLAELLAGLGTTVPRTPRHGSVWQRTVLGVLHDDLRLARAMRRGADAPLSVPLLVVSGRDDPLAGPEVMAGWRRWGADRVVQRTLPGDHFFVRGPELPRLMDRACRVMGRACAGQAAVGGTVQRGSR
ncbi:thioesterase domain-containing protein [Streptomyces griseoluteus]|uniref:thioesterase II family protein n=1 Tax=Streptomyces griseoluteus TaxID=29306 RepID=UPI0033E63B95